MASFLLRYSLALSAAIAFAGCDSQTQAPASAADLDLPSSQPKARVAVVFVHGVTGDPVTTFGNTTTNWPALLAADADIGPHADVTSVGYVSSPISKASNINEISTRVLTRLEDKDVFAQHDKIIFVAHSMGGLITKRMLLQLRMDKPEDYKKVAAVFFLATPAGGSDLAATATWVSNNPQFRDMAPEDVNTLLQLLQDDWEASLRARPKSSPYPLSFCLYETLPTGPVTIVPRSRAQMGCDERPVAFDRNHSSLVKPASRHDEVYIYVASRIKRILGDEYVPLSLSADLLNAKDQSLPENVALNSGDQFAIRISTTRPAWIYVVGQDSTGTAQRYFPSEFGGKQEVPAKTIRVPTDPSLVLRLDRQKGVERIYMFASANRSSELESLLDEVSGQASNRSTPLLDAAVFKRGVIVAKADTTKSAAPSPRFEAGSIGAEAVGTLIIEHR